MTRKLLSLRKPKLRQSWSKYNLYNLSQAKPLKTDLLTYFQQKWKAKSLTRAYHGETIREKQWQRQFRRSIRSVVSMDATDLANDDGSAQAMGRGSGIETRPEREERGERGSKRLARTPYMNMVYAPVERRLDTAIFRAMFASSIRQARQFVVHGWVKINGKKMIYPGYQLNPGDMFQVEPDRVMFATGAPKGIASETATERDTEAEVPESESGGPEDAEAAAADAETSPTTPSNSSQTLTQTTSFTDLQSPSDDTRKSMMNLLAEAKKLLKTNSALPAKRKQDLRTFQRDLQKTLSSTSKSQPIDSETVEDIETRISELTARLNLSSSTPPATTESSSSSSETPSAPQEEETAPLAPAPITIATLTSDERRALAKLLAEAQENPIDPTKPYVTPWRPRDWMSAFAFIPRYLEVHQPVCSAVYLRHPVARPGLAEVPTPFGAEMNVLTFNWYLRRR
ncbi:mitochondrial 37S ribosomal protein nam9 [Agyrium rufum]|nr:mitochondrial 37S ribosomal protein nam9 [Agyrium rufum]